ncbi:MAG TPA: M1 family aminopeptidase, partial [Chitinophagaceae bacterium]|nr:M1 family aminopeptidase [Chitinophagaceae bacterium]
YPNLAIIGPVPTRSELQTVIIHEVGHNWFYGILGSNERDYPWMDEGINSYYEEKIDNYLKKKDTVQNVKRNALSLDPALLYVLSARMHTDQGLNEAATAYTPLNYASVVYQKGGAMMRYLNSYLGDSAFDRSMKTYYGQWKFKHPRPGDLETCFKQTNASSLDWFFQDAVHTTRTVDAQIRSVQYKKESKEYRIHIHHPGSLKGPVPVSAFFKDSLLATRWIEAGKDQCVFTEQEIPGVDRFELNSMKSLPEMRFSNNDYRLHSLFHRWKPALRVGTSVGLSQKNRMYLLPALGYNVYDGFQGGLVVHNLEIPNHRLQVILNPMYAWNSKQWTGSGMLSYTFYPANKAEINTGLFFRSYHDRESHLNLNHSLFTRYYRFKPFAAIYFKKKNARSPIQDILQLQWSFVKKEAFQYRLRTSDSVYIPSVIHAPDQNAAQARFIHAHRRTFNPFQYEVYALANRNFLKLGLDTRCRIDYQMKNKSFYVRFFAGKYIQWQSQQSIFEERLQYLNLTPSGPQDLFYDETYAGRNESTGFFSKQISMREGGFKFSTRNYSDPVGTTNRWLTALNLRSDLPVKMPIHLQVFFDAATYAGAAEKNSSKQKVVYEAGLECHFFRDMLVIYAPLLLSRDLKDYLKNTYTKNRFAESLSFSLNLQQIAWFRTQHALSLIRF